MTVSMLGSVFGGKNCAGIAGIVEVLHGTLKRLQFLARTTCNYMYSCMQSDLYKYLTGIKPLPALSTAVAVSTLARRLGETCYGALSFDFPSHTTSYQLPSLRGFSHSVALRVHVDVRCDRMVSRILDNSSESRDLISRPTNRARLFFIHFLLAFHELQAQNSTHLSPNQRQADPKVLKGYTTSICRRL